MTLSAQSIRDAADERFFRRPAGFAPGLRPLIEPFCERSVVNGMSFGLSSCGYDVRIAQDVTLWPVNLSNLVVNHLAERFPRRYQRRPSFTLASTIEHFALPHDIVGYVGAKSSLARKGISVFEMTVLEPGWRGFLTLEISNRGEEVVHLRRGDPVAQIVFDWLDQPTVQPYPVTGKYQDQPNRPVPAMEEQS